ncbi:MAG: hypothetical protein WD716_00390 [Fimbriimonadaceae bacterium]
MKRTAGFVSWRTPALVLVTLAAGFALTRTVTSHLDGSLAPKKGGVDNALNQAYNLNVALMGANWDPLQLDHSLLRLPEDDSDSFAVPTKLALYDEVSFFCSTFVTTKVTIAKGEEGRGTTTGFFIVGWKDGRVTTVNVKDVRLLPKGNEPGWFFVFPGMDEYDEGLKLHPGTKSSA